MTDWNRGPTIEGGMWATKQAGNQILIDDEAKNFRGQKYADKYKDGLPKGEYLLKVLPMWNSFAKANPAVMELNVRVSTGKAKVAAEYLSEADAVKVAAEGKSKLHPKEG